MEHGLCVLSESPSQPNDPRCKYATPAEGCQICLDSCVSSIERHLFKVLAAFFFFLFSRLSCLESLHNVNVPAAYRPRMHDTCKKTGRSSFGGRVFTAQSEDGRQWYQEITETRMKGRLCDTRVPEFERTIARTPQPPCTNNRKLPDNKGTMRDARHFVHFMSAFFLYFLFYAV